MSFRKAAQGVFSALLLSYSFPATWAQSCQVCALTLDPSAAQSFSAANGARVSLNSCGLAVDSSSSTALSLSSGSRVTAGSVQVVGAASISNGASISPAPRNGAASTPDPFASAPAPAAGACTSHPEYTKGDGNSQYEIYPGTYCGGITVSNGVNAHFNPGIYVINGGGINFGASDITGTGVMFYLTGAPFTNNQPVSIDKGASVTLTAPTGGNYQGILFFQDRAINNAALTSVFGSKLALTGALYFPTSAVEFDNGSSTEDSTIAVIARTLDVESGSNFTVNPGSQILPPVAVAVAPSTAALYAGQTKQFTATVANGCSADVTWSISPLNFGSINSAGLYTAPPVIPAPQTVTVSAASLSDSSKSATATVTLYPPVSIGITPTAVTLGSGASQQFTASVANAPVTDVLWSIPAGAPGSISATGKYAAPASVTQQQNVPVIATSVADTTKSASATVTLSPPIVVTVNPPSPTLFANQTQQFTATVANASTTGVTWSIPAGSPGSISATGFYAAPASIAFPQTVTVTAKSQADNATTGTATVMLSPPVNPIMHSRAIVIDHTNVPNTDQVNFPVLVSGTFSYLATVSNGGQAQNPNGYDIIFVSDCGGTTKLDHEIESYNPATGAIAMWVRLPLVSHTTDTVFYMMYGNSAITSSQENRTGVWDSNYDGVYHLNSLNGAVVPDSTANAQNLTNFGGAPAAGVIGGAFRYNGSSYSAIDGGNFPTGAGARTVEAWANFNSPNNADLVGLGDNNNHRFALVAGSGNVGGVDLESASQTVGLNPDGAWHHMAATLPSGNTAANILLYLDGAPQSPAISNGAFVIDTSNTELSLARIPTVGFTGYYTGLLDEVRISHVARSSDWIAAEYANLRSPSTFYTILGDNTVAVSVSPAIAAVNQGLSQQFRATVTGTCNTAVTWSIPGGAPGSLSSYGLYTAPATVTSQQNVTVTATSVANTSASASATVTLSPSSSAYSFQRTIIIDHTKVPNTDQTNFPVLVSGTYSFLATAPNGGKVENANGYDIVFTTDCNAANPLHFEIESYNPVTGAIAAWVQVPNLSHTADTVFYMWYGNPAVTTTQATPTAAWDSTFQAVYHLANGATLSAADSTAHSLNGTIVGASAGPGEIGGAAGFNGQGQSISIGSAGARPTQGSISMWVKAPVLASYPNSFSTNFGGCGNAAFRFELNSAGQFGVATANDGCGGLNGVTLTNSYTPNIWHQAMVTWDSSQSIVTGYFDGQLAGQISNSNFPSTFPNVTIGIGFDSSRGWNGQVDEVRLANASRSAGWVAAEYANQSSPSTFYHLGPENGVTVSIAPAAVTLTGGQTQQFTAAVYGSCNNAVTWMAAPFGVGSLSNSGLYIAPGSVASQQIISVTAASVADSTKSAAATVNLTTGPVANGPVNQ